MMESINRILNNRKPEMIGEYKKSAVIIPLVEELGELKVLFEVRSLKLKHQPGDVCFPGGKMELGETPLETAVRETMEELNLKKENIEIIGEMDYVVSPYNFIIYPYVAKITYIPIMPNLEEVNNIFKVPLKFFFENQPEVYLGQLISKRSGDFPYNLIKGGKNYNFRVGKVEHLFYKYEEYTIWGYTALIVKHFVELIREYL